MTQYYTMIFRGRIYMPKPAPDEILEPYGCYYKSPAFLFDGSYDSMNAILDKYESKFSHMIGWTASFVLV